MSQSAPQTWLITGCSSGFGLALTRIVLEHGHNVIATSRNPSRTPELVSEIESSSAGRGKWLTLDVTSPASAINATVAEAQKIFGRIDVLVNNVGYSVLGAAEDIPEEIAKKQFEANFWGAIRVAQPVLPIMRAQGAGTIVNISSVAGQTVLPSCTMYSASKFAMEAWSEGLAQEVAAFGIRVLVVEPGAFRTNFLSKDTIDTVAVSPAYANGVVSQVLQKFDTMDGSQTGDATKAMQRLFGVVEKGLNKDQLGKIDHLRLLLGRDCFDRVTTRLGLLQTNVEASKEAAYGLEFQQ